MRWASVWPSFFDEVRKLAASSPGPTMGFYQASDLPAWKQPRLDRAIQEGEFEPEEKRADIGFDAIPARAAAISDDLTDVGIEHLERRTVGKLLRRLEARVKEGASSPTRGGFFLASDQAPPIPTTLAKGRGIEATADFEKDNDFFGTYSPSDFKPVNIMKKGASAEELSAFVSAVLEKDADVSPASSWEPGYGGSQRQESDIPPWKQPRLDRAIQKDGSLEKGAMTPHGQLAKTQHIGAPKATAPPGPSIAQIAKPRGKKFGLPIPGAMKTTI